jgi:hypothetical protein
LIVLGHLSLRDLADLGEIFTGIFSALAVVSLALVWIQVKDARGEAKIGLITGMTEQMLEVDRSLIEYPEMRRFFSNGDIPGPDEKERARAIAFSLANSLDHVVAHSALMDVISVNAWNAYIKELHEKSPVLADTLAAHPAWWPYLQTKITNLKSSGT